MTDAIAPCPRRSSRSPRSVVHPRPASHRSPRRDARLAPVAAVVHLDSADDPGQAETLVSLTSLGLPDEIDSAHDATDDAHDATDNALVRTSSESVRTSIVIVRDLDASVHASTVIVRDLDASVHASTVIVRDLDESVHASTVIVRDLDESIHTAIVIVSDLDAFVSSAIASIVGVNARESDLARSALAGIAPRVDVNRVRRRMPRRRHVSYDAAVRAPRLGRDVQAADTGDDAIAKALARVHELTNPGVVFLVERNAGDPGTKKAEETRLLDHTMGPAEKKRFDKAHEPRGTPPAGGADASDSPGAGGPAHAA